MIPRLRTNYDLRISEDGSQRMLNVLLPGTEVPIHRYPMSNENVILIKGRLDEVLYEVVASEDGRASLKEEGVYGLSGVERGVTYGCGAGAFGDLRG